MFPRWNDPQGQPGDAQLPAIPRRDDGHDPRVAANEIPMGPSPREPLARTRIA